MEITAKMVADGLSLSGGRTPDDLADRYLEKCKLAAARVPEQSLHDLVSYLNILGELDSAFEQINALTNSLEIEISDIEYRLKVAADKFATAAAATKLKFDAGFAPRLHYYTGTVFELTGRSGDAIASGGQYDRLLKSLGAGEDAAAAGVAIWVERLLAEVDATEEGA